MRFGLVVTAGLALLLSSGGAWAEGDPAKGKTAFNKCAVCHAVAPGANRVGPSMHGIVGRHAAALEGFNYSPAMKAYDVTWNRESLGKYLAAPREVVPGTKMIFVGLKNEAERDNVIAYLETLK